MGLQDHDVLSLYLTITNNVPNSGAFWSVSVSANEAVPVELAGPNESFTALFPDAFAVAVIDPNLAVAPADPNKSPAPLPPTAEQLAK